MKKTKISAFTLIELSAVIAIIGILIAGVITANGLVKKSKIAAAQSLTKASPIAGITDNALWLESSAESSFKDTESSTGDLVTTWYDQKNSVNKSSVVAVGTGPTYSNTINYIHAVKFNGSTANYLQVSDASFLNNSDYTIVVLEKRQSATAGYFIGDSAVSTANQTLLLGYSADAAIAHSQGTGNAYTSNVSTYNSSTDTPRVFTFISDSTNGKKTYINGILAAQSSDKTKLSNITTLAIGKGYSGEIGEIAIFTRALKSDERKAAEDYLGKKFSAKVNRNNVVNGSCINGIVTTNGCVMDCATSSVAGVSSPSTVADGATGITGTCGVTGYTGTVTLSCSNGILTPSGSCGCNTGSGYILSGGLCISSCPVNVAGVSSTTSVGTGTGTLTCDLPHYNNASIGYTCASGTLTPAASCTCATGYTGNGCNTCDTGNNYASDGSGGCTLQCTINGVTGITAGTKVNSGTTSRQCNATNYGGTINYTCNGTILGSVTNNCIQICSGGVIDQTSVPGSYIHTFTASGTFSCPMNKTVKVLVVGGGGGGSGGYSGAGGAGGGGGGLICNNSFLVSSSSSVTVTVGAGGAAGVAAAPAAGGAGGNSIFAGTTTLTAIGGGGGGGRDRAAVSGGGSGGGAGISGSPFAAATGTSGQGNSGGLNSISSPNYGGGGGGGAGGAGQNGTSTKGGNGGSGAQCIAIGNSNYYAGGGGSHYFNTGGTAGTGGLGGGGAPGSAGQSNTGGGGGGADSDNKPGFAGGSGVVIVLYN